MCVGGNEQINSSLTAVGMGGNKLSEQGFTILRQAMQVLQSPSPCVMLCGVDGVIVWMCVCVSVSHVWQGECLGVILFPCAWMVESACCCACPTINVCVSLQCCVSMSFVAQTHRFVFFGWVHHSVVPSLSAHLHLNLPLDVADLVECGVLDSTDCRCLHDQSLV